MLSVRVLETRNIAGNQIFPDSNIENNHSSDDTIELPKGALIENSEGGLVRIVFVAFERLEMILRPSDVNEPKSYENVESDQTLGMYNFKLFSNHHQLNEQLFIVSLSKCFQVPRNLLVAVKKKVKM